MSNLELQAINDLLEYAKKIGELNQKTIFRIEDYKKSTFFENTLLNKKGIHFNVLNNDSGDSIWLKIDRLKRTEPPLPDNSIKEWITIGKDPLLKPVVKQTIIKTLTEKEILDQIANNHLKLEDVKEPLKKEHLEINLKDAFYRLENLPDIKNKVDSYIQNDWYNWQQAELPTRETIKIYEQFFNLHSTIHNGGDDEQVELVWGTGIVRWDCGEQLINIPLIEKLIDINIDNKSGAIELYPRVIEQKIQLNPFIHLENKGVDNVINFAKKFYNDTNDIIFSPFESDTYEEVIRQAATHLDSKGKFYPDTLEDINDRTLPAIEKELQITNTWVIYLRPRESTNFIEDIKKFQDVILENKGIINIQSPIKRIVTTQSNKIIDEVFNDSTNSSSSNSNTITELYFPKPYNKAQEQIIKKLNSSNGAVVQGPPGTGKTHTIANIICHYLATGKKILVTSEHEPALSVIQEQLPEEIRKLAISILTDEHQGNKQLERAINIIQALVTQTDTDELKSQKESLEKEISKLRKELNVIEADIREWSSKQLQPIPKEISDSKTDLTAMDLANEVINNKEEHSWFNDDIRFDENYNPQFSDEDIQTLKHIRQKLADKIEYVESDLFVKDDLPELARIISIHNDMVNSKTIESKFKEENIPVMTESINNLSELVENLKQDIIITVEAHNISTSNSWIKTAIKNELFNELFLVLNEIVTEREIYIRNLVEISDPTDLYMNSIIELLNTLKSGKNPFGLFSFNKKHEKLIINNIRLNGEIPISNEQWEIVSNYLNFQIKIKRFLVKWNHLGHELKLPNINFSFGLLYPELAELKNKIDLVKTTNDKFEEIKNTVMKVFPYGIDTNDLFDNTNELNNILKYIDVNISKMQLNSQTNQLDLLYEMLYKSSDTISKKFIHFLEQVLGNTNFTTDDIQKQWRDLITELNEINSLESDYTRILEITELIHSSGAKNWTKKLRTKIADNISDELTPSNWYDSWQWKRKESYIKAISSREKSKVLFEQKSIKEKELEKLFTKLIQLNTNIGLKLNVTDLIKSSLTKFQDAIRRIGKGTGKRAPRFKKDAQNAMINCYGGIPCWIMPLWRISEILPSNFDMFDLVIIDEASQSDIRAIIAIMRAKKVLIVGDDKQVSPSVIGIKEETLQQIKHNYLREQPNASQLLPGSSIYDLARVIFPSQHIMLTEHFRCVEPIIRFSMQFYSEDLVPLRIPKSSERLDPPLIDVFVKGGMRDTNNINYSEVEAIVEEIKHITSNPKYKNRSIGVVSLIGAKQAYEIQTRLLSELGEETYLEHKIFCGDASNFQGKEKDIMFLSMVVGAKQGTAMTKLEFEQRFNVALSRARDRMYLYRSIEETDLQNTDDLKLKVIQHFKNPMPNMYENIKDNLELCDSGFERDVYKRLDDLGYLVRPQVSVGGYSIDLVVEGGHDKRLAIELDGDRYHTAENWLNDWNRQRTLERVGWIFWRCWGSDYLLDSDGCIQDLINRLESLGIKPTDDKKIDNSFTEHRIYNIINKSLS